MLPDRVSAVIIQDRKILLVSDGTGVYWTPGGKVENGETNEQALTRELHEEIKVELKNAKPYISYTTINEVKREQQQVHCFLVNFDGLIVPSEEITKYDWFSANNLPKTRKSIEENLIPKLIHDNLL